MTLIHAVVVPDLPDQKIRFKDGTVMGLQAGSTACMIMCPLVSHSLLIDLSFAMDHD